MQNEIRVEQLEKSLSKIKNEKEADIKIFKRKVESEAQDQRKFYEESI